MREILFRGKRIEDGKWIYGYYLDGKTSMADFPCITPFSGDAYDDDNDWEVDIETVGQFTGLTDKNGTKIFEGDILSAHLDNAYPEDETLLEVIWHNNGWYGKNEPFFEDFNNGFEKHFEVIGNVHDNPELLNK